MPVTSVAIKVVHPHVRKIMMRDLRIMLNFATAFSLLPDMQWLSIPEEVKVFGHMMSQQLDLRNEAKNLLVFENNFSSRKSPVIFPRPLIALTNESILVEEYENALPLKSLLENGGGPYENQIAELGLNAFLVRHCS